MNLTDKEKAIIDNELADPEANDLMDVARNIARCAGQCVEATSCPGVAVNFIGSIIMTLVGNLSDAHWSAIMAAELEGHIAMVGQGIGDAELHNSTHALFRAMDKTRQAVLNVTKCVEKKGTDTRVII